jgi:condensin complex subunit 1
MNKLHDSVTSMMGVEIEAAARDMDSDDHRALTAHKTLLEMYAFLINWISSAAEAVKTLGEEGAAVSRPKVRTSFSTFVLVL